MNFTPEVTSYHSAQSFPPRMVMMPRLHRQRSIFTTTCPQPGINYPINSVSVPYNYVRYNPPPLQQIIKPYITEDNSHGNDNNIINNDQTSKEIPTMNQTENEKKNETPIDLSSTNVSLCDKTDDSSSSNQENNQTTEEFVIKSPKKEPVSPVSDSEDLLRSSNRKRKAFDAFETDDEKNDEASEMGGCGKQCSDITDWVGHVKPVPGIPRQAGSKREEVLKAARSLFSKRTRTLYHWLYPSTSKTKLKATVAAAWDTLSSDEKDFYISQVLGRFGVPAGSLMVNPQLGGFKSVAGMVSIAGTSHGGDGQQEESRRAVSNLLMSNEDVPWASYSQGEDAVPPAKKRRRRASHATSGDGGSKGRNAPPGNGAEEETLILQQIRQEALDDDFADDPELSKEFEQFRMSTESIFDSSDLLPFDINDILEGL